MRQFRSLPLSLSILLISGLLLSRNAPAGDQVAALRSAYPNPFSDGTTFELRLPQAGTIYIAMYDILGQELRVLYDGYHPAGEHPIYWNGSDRNEVPVILGTYICTLAIDGNPVSSSKVIKVPR